MVAGFEECSDQDDMFASLRDDGYGVVRLDRSVGQPATGIVYNRDELRLVHIESRLLYKGGDIGPGTGPDHGKPKWLTTAYFIHRKTGRRIAFAVIHAYAGQRQDHGGNERQDISQLMVSRANEHLHSYTGIAFLVGDFNAEPDTPTLAALRTHGWKCDQIVGKELGTHGNWTPDQVWWHDPNHWVKFKKHHTISNGSDHDAVIADFDITAPGKTH
jgi:hypothetical protein